MVITIILPPEIRVLLLGPYSLCVEGTSILALCAMQVTMDTIGLILYSLTQMLVIWISIVAVFIHRITVTKP